MALKISGSKSSSRRLPATYQVLFTGTPKAGEVREAQGKVEKSMRRDNAKKRKTEGASKRLKLTFAWKRTDTEALQYDLLVGLAIDKRFNRPSRNGPADTQPKPKDSILPM